MWAVEQARQRIPLMEGAKIASQWAGTYEISPDNHAVMGPVPGVEGIPGGEWIQRARIHAQSRDRKADGRTHPRWESPFGRHLPSFD